MPADLMRPLERDAGTGVPRGEGWRTYRLFGLDLASDFPFTNHLPPGTGRDEIAFTRTSSPPAPWDRRRVPPAYASQTLEEGESWLSFYRLPELDVLRFAGVADFCLGTDRILWQPLGRDRSLLVETYFLGTVLACWLERSGVPSLHASAVAIDGGAVGFLSFNRGGKSSLAAALVRSGFPLLTDDVLPIGTGPDGFTARPGYPQMRLWPAEAERFWGPAEGFPKVHPDFSKVRVPIGPTAFESSERPLTCLYLPERRPEPDAPILIEALSPRDAVIELIRHSFIARLVEAAGWQAQRIDLFTGLARRVPMRRLVYPSGFEHLPRVAEAVAADAAVARG